MDIIINNEVVVFEIEELTTLNEILTLINQSIHHHNEYMTEVIINGNIMDIQAVFIDPMLKTDIQTIKITTDSILLESEKVLHELNKTILSLEVLAEDPDNILEYKDNILQIIDDIHFVLDHISNSLYVPFIYIFKQGQFLKQDMVLMLEKKQELQENFRNPQQFIQIYIQDILPYLNNIQKLYIPQMILVFNILFSKDKEFLASRFDEGLQELYQDISMVLTLIEPIISDFQMGHEQQAAKGLENMLVAYELTSQILLRCSLLEKLDAANITEPQNKIQMVIKEIDTALEEQDIITLCDTIEYEFLPAFQALLGLFPMAEK